MAELGEEQMCKGHYTLDVCRPFNASYVASISLDAQLEVGTGLPVLEFSVDLKKLGCAHWAPSEPAAVHS